MSFGKIIDGMQSNSDIAELNAAGLLLPTAALAIGIISYGSMWWTIGLSILFPVLLFHAESRFEAFSISLFYHLGATRALALSAARFYGDDQFFGVITWALGNAINGLIYAAVWSGRPQVRLYSGLLGMILTALPPLGVLGWANPLTAAGVIFPGSGLAGFLYLMSLAMSLATGSRGFIKVFLLLSLWCHSTAKVSGPMNIEGLSTSFHKTSDGGRGDYPRQVALIKKVQESSAEIVLLPEGMVTGGWTEVSETLWSKKSRKTVLIGAELLSDRPANAMVNTRTGSVYRQRQPIPFSMWRPFDEESFEAGWFSTPLIEVGGKKLAPLICYEGFLVWPIVHSFLSGAQGILATANFWWADGDQIPKVHGSILKSWSRLFSLPYAVSVNL